MNQIKQEIASIAAKFVVENGFSYYDAKTKAQELIFLRTGQKIKKKYLPNNIELDQAIKKHLMLFFKKEHLERLTELRKKAKDLMEIIKIFNPILIGSIANETVTRFSDIRVCCFTETTKEIA
ncbi:MAG: hypothetical protein CBD16_01595, partial [Betaproteobacteria bacterium TMED156]